MRVAGHRNFSGFSNGMMGKKAKRLERFCLNVGFFRQDELQVYPLGHGGMWPLPLPKFS